MNVNKWVTLNGNLSTLSQKCLAILYVNRVFLVGTTFFSEVLMLNVENSTRFVLESKVKKIGTQVYVPGTEYIWYIEWDIWEHIHIAAKIIKSKMLGIKYLQLNCIIKQQYRRTRIIIPIYSKAVFIYISAIRCLCM